MEDLTSISPARRLARVKASTAGGAFPVYGKHAGYFGVVVRIEEVRTGVQALGSSPIVYGRNWWRISSKGVLREQLPQCRVPEEGLEFFMSLPVRDGSKTKLQAFYDHLGRSVPGSKAPELALQQISASCSFLSSATFLIERGLVAVATIMTCRSEVHALSHAVGRKARTCLGYDTRLRARLVECKARFWEVCLEGSVDFIIFPKHLSPLYGCICDFARWLASRCSWRYRISYY